MQELDADIILLSEHWLKEDEISIYTINGFRPVSFFCRSEFRGGGVAIFVKQSVDSFILDYKGSKEKIFECSVITIKVNAKRLAILAVYRSPSGSISSFFEEFSEAIQYVYSYNVDYVLVLGDLNINMLENSSYSNDLERILDTFGLKVVNDLPTRVCPQSATLIDLLISDLPLYWLSHRVISTEMSDHHALEIKLSASDCMPLSKSHKSLKKRDSLMMKRL